ncbi:MAG: flagellar filament capping protein FliD [Labilithrix sp.]|nr:flagellar filament capping protein FliD [Labilithrix sp.]MCW5817178.1 flagellar filament capping protein FliD [Labilithrix sp.]
MPIQLSGLAGFDSASLVDQLVSYAQKPIVQLNTKKGQVDSASLTVNSFSTKLNALKTAATALATPSGFVSMAATSSDTALVGSVTGSAAAGTYEVSVQQLAKAQKMRSDAQPSSTTPLGQAGTLSLQIGSGDPVDIEIVETDTLTDVAAKISRSGARVSAGIINAGGSFHLSLQGLDTGASNAITLTEGGSIDLGLTKPANLVDVAQDAKLTVDGLAVTRSTNSVADAIPGVTLALTKTTTAPATMTIASDSSALKTKLNAFVSAYNDIVSSAHLATGYGSTKAQNSVLAADSAIRRCLDKVSALVTGQVPGTSTSLFRSLSAVGLSTSKDGSIALDAAKLDAALAKDPAAVSRLFVTDAQTGATGLMKTLADTISDLVGTQGPVKTRIDALAAQSKRLTASMEEKQKRVDDYATGLKKQFAALDQAMAKYNAMSASLGAITKFE